MKVYYCHLTSVELFYVCKLKEGTHIPRSFFQENRYTFSLHSNPLKGNNIPIQGIILNLSFCTHRVNTLNWLLSYWFFWSTWLWTCLNTLIFSLRGIIAFIYILCIIYHVYVGTFTVASPLTEQWVVLNVLCPLQFMLKAGTS